MEITMFLVPVNRNLSNLSHLSRSLDRFFDDNFFSSEREASAATLRSPALDVSESETAYTVTLDMPGVAKDAVKVHIDGRRISIDAEQRKDDEKKDGERTIYRERTVSRFSRSFKLPQEVSQSDSSANLDNGVLTLKLAKRSASAASQLTVN